MHNNMKCPDTHTEAVSVDTTEIHNNGAAQNDRTSGSTINAKANMQLPFEVLAHIFKLYVDDESVSAHSRSVGAFVLGAICAAWRDVAWKTPRLWASLQFCLRKRTTEGQIQLAIEWIGRSGEVPLSLSLDISNGAQETLYIPLLDTINQSLHRCCSFRLSRLTTCTLSRLFQAPKVASSLQKLELNACKLPAPFNFGLTAPNVFSMTSMRFDHILINWTNVTEFYVASISSHDIYSIYSVLDLAPQITKYRLSDFYIRGSQDIQARKAVLYPNLQDLSIRPADCYSNEVDIFFQTVTLPRLSTCCMEGISRFPAITFMDFLHRSSCHITELSFDKVIITGKNLTLITRALPSITSLMVRDSGCTPMSAYENALIFFLDALCLDSQFDSHKAPQKDILLPNLRHLTIDSTQSFFPWEYIPGFCHKYLYRHSEYDEDKDSECDKSEHRNLEDEENKDNNSDGDVDVDEEGVKRIILPGRPDLQSIYISYDFHDYDYEERMRFRRSSAYVYKVPANGVPEHLIKDWKTFSKLLKLDTEVDLNLEIITNSRVWTDLFVVSYRTLLNAEKKVPEHIKEYMERKVGSEKLEVPVDDDFW